MQNIFVIGMDEENLSTLRAVPDAEGLAFHPLLGPEELLRGEVSVPTLLDKAQSALDSFEGSVDAIVGYWDFPVSTLVPLLCARYGLRSTSLESIVKCEHKYWSRLEQRKVTDAHPRFGIVPLDTDQPRPPEGMRFPMWLKPVKSVSSELAFHAADEAAFKEAVADIKEGIARVGRPFEYVLDQLDLPSGIEEVGGQACLAEEALSGEQVAVEGYVFDGEVVVYGVLDSHDYDDSPCFLRHQYPSQLPEQVRRRLKEVSEKVIAQVGMESATFSIEYFYDAETGNIALLEINPRHSQSHARLFEYVDGVSNHHRMISLALGRDPRLTPGRGTYEMAAKWYHRWFGDGVVRKVPDAAALAELEREIPGVHVEVIPEEGQRLSELPGQDSYSYELAHVYVGADSETELCQKYERCVARLGIEVEE